MSVVVNEQFLALPGSYLFSEVARRVRVFQSQHPEADLVRMGIGDVTRPLPEAVVNAMHQAVEEMSATESFKGYGPEQGYAFLREQIVRHDFAAKGLNITPEDVFISDGCKSDMGNIGGILGINNVVAVTDPVYPVYVDSNVMDGRAGLLDDSGAWNKIEYLHCGSDNAFVPALPKRPVDIIYLCFPNNPTGTTLTKNELKKWVDYALETGALILFDAAYEAFIVEQDVPHSIYEIPGAERCAIEFRSFSKTAGFTGLRCGYTVVPQSLVVKTSDGRNVSLNALWNRRQSTKFNGVSYVTQKAAEAVYSPEGMAQCKANIAYYLENAALIRSGLLSMGWEVFGGVNAPYIWFKTPDGSDDWAFFDRLLSDVHVVSTPGSGFGPSGQGYLRLTAFGSRESTLKGVERLTKLQ
jgi:LL-diaminopimelate aminotransferase